MRRTDRLFELIQIFRDGRLKLGRELAEQLGVSLRTLYRDIETLVASGIPIEGERGVGYILREPIFLPPLNLSHIELEALQFGMELAKRSSDSELNSAANSLLQKVHAVLPANQQGVNRRWPMSVYSDNIAADIEHLPILRKAIAGRRKLDLRYRSLANVLSRRVIRPLQVEFWGQVWTCTAWCEARCDFRAFRVDHIEEVRLLDEQFPLEQGKRLEDYLRLIDCEETE
ncbi:MAG: WYL domain-containing protein [Rhizobiaceae bacterium]|nr:WYL domain-containing protein [Rhizobiaceae bacterium]